MYEFHALIETSQGKPILITGPTGVGKSLFIHMYCEWYKNRYGNNSKIISVNCSHFEKELARSELFGHVKGAYTGAIQNKNGWIEEANGGLLILDEIGELPDECQAQLLTFIEDGKFHKMGESKIRQARDLHIIAATNKEWDKPGKPLRDDLWNRFLTITIPPLYSRREDILYYIAFKDPEIIKELSTSDILTLLLYNWPGNVREIDRVISVLKSKNYLIKNNPLKKLFDYEISNLYDLKKEQTNLSLSLTGFLYHKLESSGFDVDTLELVLNDYDIGLYHESELIVFKNFKVDDLYIKEVKNTLSFEDLSNININPLHIDNVKQSYESVENQILDVYQNYFNIKILPKYEPFSHVITGFALFCFFFIQDINTYRNIIVEILNHNISTRAEFSTTLIERKKREDGGKENKDNIVKITQQAFEFMKGTMLPRKTAPIFKEEARDFVVQLQDNYFGDEDLYTTIQFEQSKQKNEMDIFSMTEKEFIKYYYDGLLKRYPNPPKIAEALDISEQTIYSRLKSLRKKGIVS